MAVKDQTGCFFMPVVSGRSCTNAASPPSRAINAIEPIRSSFHATNHNDGSIEIASVPVRGNVCLRQTNSTHDAVYAVLIVFGIGHSISFNLIQFMILAPSIHPSRFDCCDRLLRPVTREVGRPKRYPPGRASYTSVLRCSILCLCSHRQCNF